MPDACQVETDVVQGIGHGTADEHYREHLCQLVTRYAGTDGDLDGGSYQILMSVTGRSLSTLKNWFRYSNGMPDLAAMARIVAHWKIPPHEVFPSASAVEPGAQGAAAEEPIPTDIGAGTVALPFASGQDRGLVRQALQRYSLQSETLVWLRQDSGDAAGVVENGELMLVDTSVERIQQAGLFVLRTNDPEPVICTRMVQPLIGRPEARISLPGSKLAGAWEDMPLQDGLLKGPITVLGRVVGRLQGV